MKADLGSVDAVWSGTELLVFTTVTRNGSNGPILNGVAAAYNPSRNTWRKLAAFPYAMNSIEGGNRAVWDGSEMLIWGEANGAYDPRRSSWRPLRPPLIGAASVTVWTGRQVIMWGGGCCASARADGAVYNIAHDTWQPIPAAPLAGRHAPGVWTGTELVIAGGAGLGGASLSDAAAYNPSSGTWRHLPSLPAARSGASMTWTGADVVVAGGFGSYRLPPYTDAMAYDPATNQWRRLADMPDNRYRHCAVWTGQQLIVLGGRTAASGQEAGSLGSSLPQQRGWSYDPIRNQWSTLPPSPPSAYTASNCIWTGNDLIALSAEGGAIYTPQQ
jgi:N-acetylneuraminic acid mutarotase